MEEIALNKITAMGTQLLKLYLVLNSFGEQFQAQRLAQANHSTNNRTAFFLPFDAIDKSLGFKALN